MCECPRGLDGRPPSRMATLPSLRLAFLWDSAPICTHTLPAKDPTIFSQGPRRGNPFWAAVISVITHTGGCLLCPFVLRRIPSRIPTSGRSIPMDPRRFRTRFAGRHIHVARQPIGGSPSFTLLPPWDGHGRSLRVLKKGERSSGGSLETRADSALVGRDSPYQL
ncbi:hypothetical protein LY76DRAFT_118399 [Colletotrichum caudatum]|nr:hypothetical protein LY76DRAFT_118399 [Colletotrichum caudatum]